MVDGEQLFHNNCRPITILKTFQNESKEEMFHYILENKTFLDEVLFEEEKNSWKCSISDEMYSLSSPSSAPSSGYKTKEELYQAMKKFYLEKGSDKFFEDLNATWDNNNCTAFA
jgi:hypothetical protein